MTFAIFYIGAGLYMALMLFGILHRNYMKRLQDPHRMGLSILSLGLIILGSYNAWFHFFMQTDQGREIQRVQQQLNQEAFEHELKQRPPR